MAGEFIDNANLAEAVSKLASAIESSHKKLTDSLKKITGLTPTASSFVNQEVTDEEVTKRKRGKVLEEVINIKVTEFGDKALNQLSKILGGLVTKEKETVKPSVKRPDNTFLKKLLSLAPLLLPIAFTALKALAGLTGDKVLDFLSNLFPKLFDTKAIGVLLKGITGKIKNLFIEGIKAFKETKAAKFFSNFLDDILKGFKENKIIQGIFGETGIFAKVFGKAGFFSKMFGEGSMFVSLFKEGGVALKVLKGGVFAKLFTGVGKTIFKRIPLLGSIFNFYDSYQAFTNNDYLKGFISLFSGIANIFPGYGTLISIGLDVLNYILDTKSFEPFKYEMNQGRFLGAFGKLGDMLVKKVPFVKWFYDLAENITGAAMGDKESLIQLFNQFGLKSVISWMIATGGSILPSVTVSAISLKKVTDVFVESIVNPITNFFTEVGKKLRSVLGDYIDFITGKVKVLFGGEEEIKKISRENIKTEEDLRKYREQKRLEKAQLQETLQDFTSDNYVKRGETIRKFSKDDTVIGFKEGGELSKVIKTITKNLENIVKLSGQQLELSKKQLEALTEMAEKKASNVMTNSISNNNYVMGGSSVQAFRSGAIA